MTDEATDSASETSKRAPLAAWLAVVGAYLLVPVILTAVGGDMDWWQAWAVSILVHVAGVGGRVAADRRHPGLQADRLRFGRGQEVKAWDRILAPLMGFTVLYVPVFVAALDHRFGWTTPYGAWTNAGGISLCAVGYAIAVWALVENRFFTSLVRIQTERGHQVCDTGPYRFVRHPGYAGNLLAIVGLPLALDSAWAFMGSGVALVASVVRTALEDRTLLEELDGYRAYANRVRSRLVPGLW